MTNAELFAHESDYPDFPSECAVEHLRNALRFPTVSHLNTSKTDYSAFDAFHLFLRVSYPHIVSACVWETIGHSLLLKLPGSTPSLRPALFMAHQDVVPIKSGTEKNWQHAPFSGDLADGFIWGRGALDIKEMLIGHLEAMEYLLSRGGRLQRTVYFAFGEDEETCSGGAIAICNLLRKRGIELEYVLDEGAGDVMDAADYGAPGTLACLIGIYEKGYMDLRLNVQSRGGHSSNPFHGTSLGHLSEAIASIVSHPRPPVLTYCLKSALRSLSPYITVEPMKTWVSDMTRYEKELLAWCMSRESLYHQVSTTIAPTMISEGSPAANVLPQDMWAVINMRLAPSDPPEVMLEHCRGLVPSDVELSLDQQIEASRPSDIDSYGFIHLKQVLEHYFQRLIFIPAQNRGATDCRQYEPVCRCCLRFGPFLEEEAVSAEGIHGTNERISVRAYLQGIRVLTRLMETTCMNPEEME